MSKEDVKETKECTDYYGDIIREGNSVILINNNSMLGIVLEIVEKENNFFINILYNYKTILYNENPKDYCILKNGEERNNRINKWIKKDIKEKRHKYTKYKDIDGIPLAERMVLEDAWKNERKLYYVAKDPEKDDYYLQSFFEYRDKKSKKDRVISVKRDIEYAIENLQVESYFESGKVSFLEDYGFENGTFPPIKNNKKCPIRNRP